MAQATATVTEMARIRRTAIDLILNMGMRDSRRRAFRKLSENP
jgi:hypothetical protein